MKARTLLLMFGLSLASAPAAERIVPFHGLDGFPVGLPDTGRDLRPRVPQTARDARVIPLPRPRPFVPEKTGAIRDDALNPVAADPTAAPMPQAAPLAAPGPQNAPTTAAHFGAPVKGNGGAATPPVSIADAGGGRIRIEAHGASVAQVLAAVQEAGLIRSIASDQLSRTVSGTYTGTLPQVLSRILDGYNYFLRVTESGTELRAVDVSSEAKAALPTGSNDSIAALPSAVDSKAVAAPLAAFALSPPNPVSKARARVRVEQAAKRH